jgi:hypothetical protein
MEPNIACTGPDYLDTVLQLRPPFAWHKPNGLRLPRRPPRAPAHDQALRASTGNCDDAPAACIFPNSDSCLRLVSALLAELDDE